MQRHDIRRRRIAGDLGDTCQQAAGGAELGDRGELLDGCGEADLELSERGGDVEPAAREGAQRGDDDGEGVAELLSVGCSGVVETRSVDRRHAHVGVLAGVGAALVGQHLEGGVESGPVAVIGPGTERVGTERPTHRGRVDARSGPDRPQRSGRLDPLWTGVEDDRGDVEENAVEDETERLLVDDVVAADAQPHRGRASFELGDGGAPPGAGIDDLTDVPGASRARRSAGDRPQAGCTVVGGGVQRLDRDAVVRRRPQALDVAGERQPTGVIGGRELRGERQGGVDVSHEAA